ncbi:MAG: DUF3365 domain-containing protein [Prolixibacteraceae bacterium]
MRQLSLFILILLFSACGGKREKKVQQQQLNEQETERHFLEKGKEIASATQAELLKIVQDALAKGGPEYAIDFCKLEALNLKDSLSALTNSKIQRLSLKYRNPADKPQLQTELDQLMAYQALFDEGKQLSPGIHVFDDRVVYYQPIMIASGACLLCHGDPETQIAKETMQVINRNYADDHATGYALNDFRGMWKITFQN